MELKKQAQKLKETIPIIFIAFKSPKTPFYAKLFAGITIVYALSPIDLIPDFIPILGYLDDVILLPFLIWLTIQCIPKSLWIEYEVASKDLWKNGKIKPWYFAIPIIVIDLVLLCYLFKLFQSCIDFF